MLNSLSATDSVDETLHFWTLKFENDVKMYGTQTSCYYVSIRCLFENDVKMYGTQTVSSCTTR